MSICKTAVVTCPECKKDFEVVYWDSLNGNLNPKEKEKLLEGNLFKYKCEHCGNIIPVFYNVLYHDISNQAMIWFSDEENVDKVYEGIELAKSQFSDVYADGDYKFRIVFDHNDLREKALIIDNGLDDRVIEIIKIMYEVMGEKDYSNEEIKKMYFDIDNGEYILVFFLKSGGILTSKISEDFYNMIENKYRNTIEEKSENEYVINRAWAIEFFENQ